MQVSELLVLFIAMGATRMDVPLIIGRRIREVAEVFCILEININKTVQL